MYPQPTEKATFVVFSQPYSHHIISSGPHSTLVAITTPVANTASWWVSVFPITTLQLCGLSLPQRPQIPAQWSSAYIRSHHSTLVVFSLPLFLPKQYDCPQISPFTPPKSSLWSSAYSCSQHSQPGCPQQTPVVSSHYYGGPQLNHVVSTIPF